jgi:hypothetical protein
MVKKACKQLKDVIKWTWSLIKITFQWKYNRYSADESDTLNLLRLRAFIVYAFYTMAGMARILSDTNLVKTWKQGYEEQDMMEWVEKTHPWVEKFVIVNHISRIIILFACIKWPQVSHYFIYSIILYWLVMGLVPIDVGDSLKDIVVVFNAIILFITLYVDFTPSFVCITLYVATILLVIHPAMHQVEYNVSFVITKILFLLVNTFTLVVFGCVVTLILIL